MKISNIYAMAIITIFKKNKVSEKVFFNCGNSDIEFSLLFLQVKTGATLSLSQSAGVKQKSKNKE